MAETDTSEVLSLLRERFNRIDAANERMEADLHDIKVRVTAFEEGLAGVNRRLDRLDERTKRIGATPFPAADS